MSALGLDTLLLRNPVAAKFFGAITTAAAPFTNQYLLPAATVFTSNAWYCYGIGPVIAVFLGLVVSATVLEWLAGQSWMQRYMITYSAKETRAEQVAKTQAKVPWIEQVKSSLWQVAGPTNILGCAFQRYLLEYLHGGLPDSSLPTLPGFLIDFALLMLIADLGLYWGHRIQHSNEYLWDNCHSVHHRLQTPTAWSVAYIEARDSLLQAAGPLILSQLIVRPHPVTAVCYLYFHLSNNCLNHSGINAWWLDLIALKWLPLRCDNTLHDAHHRFSGKGSPKNCGEMVWLWDWLFGTLTDTAAVMTRKRNAE